VIGKLGLIMVVVKDMKRSVAFYRDALGLKLEYESPHWSQLNAGTIQIGLHPEGKEVKVNPTTGLSFGFYVPDVQKAVAELKTRGARMLMEPRKENFGWLAMVRDPDGYAIQLGEEPKGH
jgi:lactoylglutathione lyase